VRAALHLLIGDGTCEERDGRVTWMSTGRA
jgi:hypothetical protein